MITRLVCCLFLQFIFSSRTVAIVSTACYGPPGTGCTDHRLICTEPLVISITNITFGYRQGCLGNCGNLTCCREEAGDCFTPYNQTLLSQLQQTCNGRSTCTLNSNNGLYEVSSSCGIGNTFHSYSKIEYQCTSNTVPLTPTTTPSTTTKTISNTIASNQASTVLTNTQETMTEVSTACYGSPGIGGCTEHRLTCIPSLVISITNITFGYRRGCRISGVSNCVNTTCCREEPGDCFTPYNQTLLSQLQQTCIGKSTCTLNANNGLTEVSSLCSLNTRHSYSKIEYHCVSTTTPPTPQPTTETTSSEIISNTIATNRASTDLANTQELPTPAPDSTTTALVLATVTERETDTDVGGIVGGIVSVIIFIAIVGVVIFFIKRRLKKVKSQNEHQYESTPSRIIDQPTTVDDSLNTRSQTDERTQYINEQPLPATTNGQTQDHYVIQDYEHAYNSTPSIGTDEPKAVYDSLNTREHTGYYNMGNINATSINGRTPTNTNNPDYEHAYSALDHDTNKPKTVYDSFNTRDQTGYYNMGSINTTGDSQQSGTNKDTAQNRT